MNLNKKDVNVNAQTQQFSLIENRLKINISIFEKKLFEEIFYP